MGAFKMKLSGAGGCPAQPTYRKWPCPIRSEAPQFLWSGQQKRTSSGIHVMRLHSFMRVIVYLTSPSLLINFKRVLVDHTPTPCENTRPVLGRTQQLHYSCSGHFWPQNRGPACCPAGLIRIIVLSLMMFNHLNNTGLIQFNISPIKSDYFQYGMLVLTTSLQNDQLCFRHYCWRHENHGCHCSPWLAQLLQNSLVFSKIVIDIHTQSQG